MPISETLKRAIKTSQNQTVFTVGPSDVEGEDRPDTYCDLCSRQLLDLQVMRDVMGGTRAMRDAGDSYLPQREEETDTQYDNRLKLAFLFNATERTRDGLVGMLFRKDPVVVDADQLILDQLEDVDLSGTPFPVWAKRWASHATADGHVAIHIDFPTVTGVRNRADERALNVRPYWRGVRKDQLINIQWEMVNGQPMIVLAVLAETVTRRSGRFGEVMVDRLRVLEPGMFEVFEKNDADEWISVEAGVTSLPYVPLVPLYATQPVDHYETVPPLLNLAWENINHWQLSTNRRWTLEVAGVPLPWFKGVQDQERIVWGPMRAMIFKGENAEAGMLEIEGKSLSEVRQEKLDCEGRMAALGLSMLVRETRAAETAEAKKLDRSEGDSALATAAAGIEAGLNEALRIHADYLGIEEPGRITINRDFIGSTISPQMVSTLMQAVTLDLYPYESFLMALEQGELPLHDEIAQLVAEHDAGIMGVPEVA